MHSPNAKNEGLPTAETRSKLEAFTSACHHDPETKITSASCLTRRLATLPRGILSGAEPTAVPSIAGFDKSIEFRPQAP